MTIRPIIYYIVSLLASITTCLMYVFRACEIYGDEDYVYNYLRCTPDGDSTAIPIMGAISVSIFWIFIHIIAHIFFILITRAKEGDKNFKIRFGFYRNEKIASWLIKSNFYLFALFLLYDFIISFYKFYIFDFLSFVTMMITTIIYCFTITNSIGVKENEEPETKKPS